MKRDEFDIDEVLRSFPSASNEQVEAGRQRIFDYLRLNASARDLDRKEEADEWVLKFHVRHSTGRRWFISAAFVAAVFLGALWVGIPLQDEGPSAVVLTADGPVYRVVDGRTLLVRPGDRIEAEETIRLNGGDSAMIALRDGSLVEMRSESELSLERAVDGVRVRLPKGDIIVNAAKQHRGHLYVQTNDVTVSVVGTVFLVNADAKGSSVAVIEGEVHVKHGGTEKSLYRGEQVATIPTIPQGLREQISWSRNAEAHLALLQQSVTNPNALKGGSVTGVVRNSSGQPASGFRVTAMRADSLEDSLRAMVSLAETDSTGRYQLDNVPPGRYFITAGRLDVLTYYPGTLEVRHGLAISVTSAATVTNVDFVIQDSSAEPPPPRAQVSFRRISPGKNVRLTDDEMSRVGAVVESLMKQGGSGNESGKEGDTETEGDKMIKDILKSIAPPTSARRVPPEDPNQK